MPGSCTLEGAQHAHAACGTHPRPTRCLHHAHWPPSRAYLPHSVPTFRPDFQPHAPQPSPAHHQYSPTRPNRTRNGLQDHQGGCQAGTMPAWTPIQPPIAHAPHTPWPEPLFSGISNAFTVPVRVTPNKITYLPYQQTPRVGKPGAASTTVFGVALVR